MKKIFMFLSLAVLIFSCSEENDSELTNKINAEDNIVLMRSGDPCPKGTTASLSYEFNTMRLHRASKNCEKGFGICSDGFWVIDCADEFGTLIAQAPLGRSGKETQSRAFIHSDKGNVNLYFPSELTEQEGFSPEDFEFFSVDEDWEITTDVLIKKGDYPLNYTSNGLIQIVLETY